MVLRACEVGLALRGNAPWVTDHGAPAHSTPRGDSEEASVIILGLILLIIGLIAGISILWTIGLILLIVGAVLWLMGSMGRAVGGRRHYW